MFRKNVLGSVRRYMWLVDEVVYRHAPFFIKVLIKKRDVERYSFETRKVGGKWYIVDTCFSCGEEIGLTSIESVVRGEKPNNGMYCIPCEMEWSKR